MAQQVSLTVRMPPDLHEALARAAADELLSGAAFLRRLAQAELRRKGYVAPLAPEAANG